MSAGQDQNHAGVPDPGGGETVLATVMFTDVVGFTGRTQADEAGTIQQVRSDLLLIRQRVEVEGGRVVKETGDGLLAVFNSAQRAVGCAVALQTAFSQRSAAHSQGDEPLTHRISLHVGELETVGGDVYGDGVNICARLLEHAKPHGVVLSEPVYALVKPRLPMAAKALGRLRLKNVSEKVAAYHLWFRAASRRPSEALLDAQPRTGLPTGNWYCPRCDYNLRGRPAGCCSECGWEYDADLRTVSLIPWMYRRQIGRFRALLRTSWLATWHPARLAAELHRPITFSDASTYFRLVVSIVWLSSVLTLGVGMHLALGHDSASRDVRVFALVSVIVMGAAASGVILSGAAGVLMIFRAPEPSPDLQNRLAAIGRYSAGPILWLAVLFPAAWALTLWAPRWAEHATVAVLPLVLILHAVAAYRLRTLAHPCTRIRKLAVLFGVAIGWLIPIAIVATVVLGTMIWSKQMTRKWKFAPPRPATTRSTSAPAIE